jgi:hypothetical protein
MGNETPLALRFNAIGQAELSPSIEPRNMFHLAYDGMARRFPYAPGLVLHFYDILLAYFRALHNLRV